MGEILRDLLPVLPDLPVQIQEQPVFLRGPGGEVPALGLYWGAEQGAANVKGIYIVGGVGGITYSVKRVVYSVVYSIVFTVIEINTY